MTPDLYLSPSVRAAPYWFPLIWIDGPTSGARYASNTAPIGSSGRVRRSLHPASCDSSYFPNANSLSASPSDPHRGVCRGDWTPKHLRHKHSGDEPPAESPRQEIGNLSVRTAVALLVSLKRRRAKACSISKWANSCSNMLQGAEQGRVKLGSLSPALSPVPPAEKGGQI